MNTVEKSFRIIFYVSYVIIKYHLLIPNASVLCNCLVIPTRDTHHAMRDTKGRQRKGKNKEGVRINVGWALAHQSKERDTLEGGASPTLRYQNLSLSSTTNRRIYRTPLIPHCLSHCVTFCYVGHAGLRPSMPYHFGRP